jgi:hypothetical protein
MPVKTESIQGVPKIVHAYLMTQKSEFGSMWGVVSNYLIQSNEFVEDLKEWLKYNKVDDDVKKALLGDGYKPEEREGE